MYLVTFHYWICEMRSRVNLYTSAESWNRSVWLQQREFHLLSSPRWLVLIGWAELAPWMKVASNNPLFLFPKSIVRAGERLYQWLSEHAVASWNISCGGQKKDGFSSLSVLPLNETGGKLTYRVIVTNIAGGELSVALPPFHCGD